MQTIQGSILIQKYGVKNFRHVCIAPNQSYTLSKWDVNINDELFRVKEISGAYREGCLWQNVTFQDVSSGGSVEPFGSKQALINRLIAVGYNAFFYSIGSINGLIEAGTNVSVTGSGTADDPYVINSSGGGGGTTPYNTKVTYSGAITVPSGFTLTRVWSPNDIYTDFTGVVVGTSLIITGAVTDDVYLIDGYY